LIAFFSKLMLRASVWWLFVQASSSFDGCQTM
jgi:hypothetical protein